MHEGRVSSGRSGCPLAKATNTVGTSQCSPGITVEVQLVSATQSRITMLMFAPYDQGRKHKYDVGLALQCAAWACQDRNLTVHGRRNDRRPPRSSVVCPRPTLVDRDCWNLLIWSGDVTVVLCVHSIQTVQINTHIRENE